MSQTVGLPLRTVSSVFFTPGLLSLTKPATDIGQQNGPERKASRDDCDLDRARRELRMAYLVPAACQNGRETTDTQR